MNNIIIGLVILLALLYYCYQSKEHFTTTTTPSTTTPSTTTPSTTTPSTTTPSTTTPSTTTPSTTTPSTTTIPVTTEAPDPDIIDITFNSTVIDEADNADISESIETPDIILETVGNTKLILHWQNDLPDTFELVKYLPKVYECKGIHDECDISKSTEITDYQLPNIGCKSCYMVINNLNMTENTYHITFQLLYQSKASGKYFKTPIQTKTTTREVEQDLNNLYQKALEHLIEEKTAQKKLNLDQYLQKKQINELKDKISKLKTRLLQNEKYNEKIKQTYKPPYDLKAYHNKVNYYDASEKPQQTITIDGNEYYLGIDL
jgi:hypothetical protein